MKLKLAICTTDQNFAARFINYFNIHYSDRTELSQFTDITILGEYSKKEHPDICLIGTEFLELAEGAIAESSIISVLTEEADEEAGNFPCVYKYQKAEMIYKELLNIYADRRNGFKAFHKHASNEAHTYVFCSASGGAGATTVALAYAIKLAKEKNVLYLNLQQYSNADLVLRGEGNGKFDDVIFALKSKRGTLSLKLEGLVRKSKENVNFFASCDNPLDLQEITVEELQRLIREVVTCGLYQDVIIDIDSKLGQLEIAAMEAADYVVLVEGGNLSNSLKYTKFHKALETIENREGKDLLSKLLLFYNRFSNKTGMEITENQIPVIGGIPRFEGVQMEAIVSRMAMLDVWNQLKSLENGEG